MTSQMTQWNATIQETPESVRILLNLRADGDGMYRWYESETGADTEVSGSTEQEAIENAELSWKAWWHPSD